MSTSIRLSDDLIAKAKKQADLYHRSPPQQIEHWAEIGRVLEPSLTYHIQEKVKTWGSHEDIDDLVDEIESVKGKERIQEVISKTSSQS